MALKERITSIDKLRSWTDQIPLHYEYSAGVAGEKFLRGLQRGKILASECERCRRRYVPPKTYCVNCYVEIRKFRSVGLSGTVAALAESHVAFDGKRARKPTVFAFVTFRGVTGGLIHRAGGKGLAIGSKVVPKFRPVSKRTGTLLDIEKFVVS